MQLAKKLSAVPQIASISVQNLLPLSSYVFKSHSSPKNWRTLSGSPKGIPFWPDPGTLSNNQPWENSRIWWNHTMSSRVHSQKQHLSWTSTKPFPDKILMWFWSIVQRVVECVIQKKIFDFHAVRITRTLWPL
jgi:hypothetical protein